MAHSYEDEDSDISESELEDFSTSIFEKLKGGAYEFKCPDGSFRCPFCVKKKRKNFKHQDLVQHANGIASSNRNFKQVAFHQALARFLTVNPARELQQQKLDLDVPHGSMEVDEKVLGDEEVVYVWPWMGIIVNIPTVFNKDAFQVGENGPKLKLKYSQFNPVKVHALWNFRGHTGNAVVEFRRDWSGFQDALNFSRYFEAEQHGRKQWRDSRHRPTSICGWIADEDDYRTAGIIGDHLRKNGDLKTITELQQEQSRKQSKLVATLANQITKQEENLEHLRREFQKTSDFLETVIKEKDLLDQIHNDGKLMCNKYFHALLDTKEFLYLFMTID